MENKDPVVVMHTRNSNAPTTTEDNTQTAKEPLQKRRAPPRRKQCTSFVVAQSKILSFHPGESMSSQNNAFSKGIVRYKQ
jgi:hypothetical protein